MMKLTGRPALWLLILLFSLGSQLARGAVEASVDRTRIALGDTLRLVITATEEDEELSSVSLDELRLDWEVLSRSTRSNTTIVNGQQSHERQLQMDITPLRTGALPIPAFEVGAGNTRALLIQVDAAPDIEPGDETVLFEASVDRDSVYVQGQLILTLRLQQAVNLDGRSISDLDLPGAFVVPLEQKSFQRQVNGRPWLVHEVRYAIFPEQSGTLTIPAQSFSARESVPRRSIFDTNRGRMVRLYSEPLKIQVLPRPPEFSGDTWLPARELVLEEEWSSDPAQLRAGESVTRSIRLRGEGLQGAQLPPVLLPPTEGIKQYPDQPGIAETEISSGLLGARTDSVAIVPTRAGSIELPAIEIPWWDTEARVMRTARIPARTLQVAAAAIAPLPDQGLVSSPTGGQSATATQSQSPLLWQLLALLCGCGWLLTAVLWWRSRHSGASLTQQPVEVTSPRAAFKSLLAACVADQPIQARKQLIQWVATLSGDSAITTLQQASATMADRELTAELEALDKAIYGPKRAEWCGDRLRKIVERLQRQQQGRQRQQEEPLRLYPAA